MNTTESVSIHRRLGTALALTLVHMAVATPTGATALFVDRFDDSPSATSCSILVPGDCSLRGAILHANQGSVGDVLFVPPGTYTLIVAGTGEDQAAAGDLDILFDLNINGVRSGEVIIDGNGLDRVFDIRDSAVVTMSDITITGGASPGSTGGGARVGSTADLTLTNVTVRNNSALTGGGLYSYGTLDVISSRIRNNTASASGGGIATTGTLYFDLTDSEIGPGNSAINGGGIYNGCFHAHLYESSIWGNSVSGNGAGIYNADGMGIDNCSFFVNMAFAGVGGAIFNDWYLQLDSVTITGNAAHNNIGTAISNTSDGILGMVGTLIQGTCSDDGGTWDSYGGNLESPGNSCSLDHDEDQILVGDPMLGDAAYHGGPTLHFNLDPGSPAVDGGTHCPATDQRGQPSPQDGDENGTEICDVGAYEFNPNELLICSFESGATTTWSETSP